MIAHIYKKNDDLLPLIHNLDFQTGMYLMFLVDLSFIY